MHVLLKQWPAKCARLVARGVLSCQLCTNNLMGVDQLPRCPDVLSGIRKLCTEACGEAASRVQQAAPYAP